MATIDVQRQNVKTVIVEQRWMGNSPDVSVFLAFAEKLKEAVEEGVKTSARVDVSTSGFRLRDTQTQALP